MIERVLCLLIGYIFGLFQTGYIYGKFKHIDIRNQGSGNAGTTNALRVLGWQAGLITFLGDAFKCIFAVIAVRLIFGGMHPELAPLYAMYAGMGAVFGHNYPFYMKFKGGKGIATTAGLLASTLPLPMVLVCLAAFLIVVGLTRYVSVGSLVVVTIYLIEIVFYGQQGGFGVPEGAVRRSQLLQRGEKTFGSASGRAGLPGTGDTGNFFRLLFLREASHQLGGCGSSKPPWTGRQPDLGGGAS